ncbi:MAG: DUF5711 family protein [Oscillospiraceae bacterium]|jgi:hypothetical protein|nr:DUF5711 family protein [Oscillospiraceae bacterium]
MNDIIKRKKKVGLLERLKLVFISFFVSFLLIFFFINHNLFYPNNISCFLKNKIAEFGCGPGFPVEFEGENVEIGNFSSVDGDCIILSDTSYTVLNKTAKAMISENHNLSNPKMKISRLRNLIYDCGGNDFRIMSKSEQIFKGKLEQNITSAAISERDTYGFITDSNTYNSEMIIFDGNKKQKYKFYFARIYASDIAIKADGKQAAVCGLESSSGTASSMIYVFDYKSEIPKFTFNFPGNMIISIDYLSNGNIVAIGSKSSIFIDSHGEVNEFNYRNYATPCTICVDKYSGIALTFSKTYDERNQNIILLDKKGSLVSEIETGRRLRSISRRHQSVAVLSENKVLVYNTYGHLKFECNVPSSVERIELISNFNLNLLGKGNVEKICSGSSKFRMNK